MTKSEVHRGRQVLYKFAINAQIKKRMLSVFHNMKKTVTWRAKKLFQKMKKLPNKRN